MVKNLTSLTSDKNEFTEGIQMCSNRTAVWKPKILKDIFKDYLFENIVLVYNCWISFYFLIIYEVDMKLLLGRNRANTARVYSSMSFSDLWPRLHNKECGVHHRNTQSNLHWERILLFIHQAYHAIKIWLSRKSKIYRVPQYQVLSLCPPFSP